MARQLTKQEKLVVRHNWPKMDAERVVVTDEKTKNYNCLAWTLGITSSWVWPWGSRPATRAEFDALYKSKGFKPSDSGPIGAFGNDPATMHHGSISGSGHGSRWESKCGQWLRIQHGLGEMEGGSYGSVLGYYSKAAVTPMAKRPKRVGAPRKLRGLSKDELMVVRTEAKKLSPELREAFEAAYADWTRDWEHPAILVSSSPVTRTYSPSFLQIVNMGSEILPCCRSS